MNVTVEGSGALWPAHGRSPLQRNRHRLLDRHRAVLPADKLHRLRATAPAAGRGGVRPASASPPTSGWSSPGPSSSAWCCCLRRCRRGSRSGPTPASPSPSALRSSPTSRWETALEVRGTLRRAPGVLWGLSCTSSGAAWRPRRRAPEWIGRLPQRERHFRARSPSAGHDDSMLGGSVLERSLRRRRAAIQAREHGLHHDRPVAGKRRGLAQARCRSGKLHSPAARGNARSRTASAAKSSASRTSSASRSGYSARIPSVVCPSATRATTVATGIRRPRRHGTPPIWRGLVVILLNSIMTV